MAVQANLAALTAASALAFAFATAAAAVALPPPTSCLRATPEATLVVAPSALKPSARTGTPPDKFK